MKNFRSFNALASLFSITLITLLLGACVSTQVMPVAPNVVQINTQAKGLLYAGKAVPETMTAAARETLARGYSHFKFSNVSSGQGSEISGASSYGGGNISGNNFGNTFGANYNGYGYTNINRRPTESAAVTVVMFHANEAGAKGAFNAQQVLLQYQSK